MRMSSSNDVYGWILRLGLMGKNLQNQHCLWQEGSFLALRDVLWQYQLISLHQCLDHIGAILGTKLGLCGQCCGVLPSSLLRRCVFSDFWVSGPSLDPIFQRFSKFGAPFLIRFGLHFAATAGAMFRHSAANMLHSAGWWGYAAREEFHDWALKFSKCSKLLESHQPPGRQLV